MCARINRITIQIKIPMEFSFNFLCLNILNEIKIIEAVHPGKDVDGFHPISVGNLVIGNETFLPCTPAGIQELLVRSNILLKGKHVVVVGRSNIVGKPIANILLQKKGKC